MSVSFQPQYPPCACCSRLSAGALRDALRARKGDFTLRPCKACLESAASGAAADGEQQSGAKSGGGGKGGKGTGKAKKGFAKAAPTASDVHASAKGVLQGTWICLTCCFAGCEEHAQAHYEGLNRKQRRDREEPADHAVFLDIVTSTIPDPRAKCHHCVLHVGCGAPEDDCWSRNAGGSCAVNDEGYCIDYEDYVGPPAQAILAAMATSADGASARGDDGDGDGGSRKGKKKEKKGNGKSSSASSNKHRKSHSAHDSDAAAAAGIVGLRNMGNTCFFNSVLQCLARCAPLASLCEQAAEVADSSQGFQACPFSKAVAGTIAAVSPRPRTGVAGGSLTPKGLFALLCRRNCIFAEYGQQDAQELYATIANGVVDEFRAASTAGKHDAYLAQQLSGLFGGTFRRRLVCGACEHATTRTEGFMELAIPLEVTVQKGITSALADEHVSAADGFACEKCNAAQFAQQQRQRDAVVAQRLADARTHAADSAATGEVLIADAESRADTASVADDAGDDGSDGDNGSSSSDDSSSDNPRDSGDAAGTTVSGTVEETGPLQQADASESSAPHASQPIASTAAAPFGVGAGWGCISTAVEAAAPILVIHVKRFRFSAARCAFVKDDAAVHVDEIATLPVEAAGVASAYRLVGVVHHHGSLDAGHYTATVKSATTGQWLHCSDDEVTKSHCPAQASRSAYLAVYCATTTASTV